MSDHYATLELAKTASQEDVKKSYIHLAKKWHPDKNPDNMEEATIKFKQINVAFKVLSDEYQKMIYDESVKLEATNSSTLPDLQSCNEKSARKPSVKVKPTLWGAIFRRTSVPTTMNDIHDDDDDNDGVQRKRSTSSRIRPKTSLLGNMLQRKNSEPVINLAYEPSGKTSQNKTKFGLQRRQSLWTQVLRHQPETRQRFSVFAPLRFPGSDRVRESECWYRAHVQWSEEVEAVVGVKMKVEEEQLDGEFVTTEIELATKDPWTAHWKVKDFRDKIWDRYQIIESTQKPERIQNMKEINKAIKQVMNVCYD